MHHGNAFCFQQFAGEILVCVDHFAFAVFLPISFLIEG